MKKRFILYLVAIFSVVFMIFALSGCTYNKGNQDVSVANFVQGTTPYETLKTFVNEFPNRTSIQQIAPNNTKDAALWIASKLKEFGYETLYNLGTDNEGLDIFTYENTITNKTEMAYNVVFKKESSSNKKVVIGTHFDNVYDLTLDNGRLMTDGTYDNGVGVATLIETARVLKDKNLPFDLEFVAFDAQEFGWYGSKRYLSNQLDKENIILMINFDKNAIGDYVYMYSSEAKTKHNKYFYDIAKENNLCIADLPSYRFPMLEAAPSNSYYSNDSNWTDSDIFLAEGINIINFISLNYQVFKESESSNRKNILYTENDNFSYVVDMLGGENDAKVLIDKQINSAISSVVYAFEKEDFVDVMSVSKANNGMDIFANSTIMMIITFAFIGVVIIALVILYYALGTKAKAHDVYVNTIYGRLNKTTGKIENVNTAEPKTSGENVGSVFGTEFDNQNKTNADAEQNKTTTNSDKTNDIFGDF